MEDLLERVLAIARAFDEAGIPHSFGGAIALGFYAEVRLTHDIDINVYLGVEDAERALACLDELGVEPATDAQRATLRRDAQTRLYWKRIPIDLFFSNLEFHHFCSERRQRFSLLGSGIDVLSPEDLIVCKVSFAREKDLRDIGTLLDSIGETLDLTYVLHWVDQISGRDAAAARELSTALATRSLLPAE